MRNSLRWLSLFMAPALVISLSALMVACGGDDGEGGGDDATAVLNVVSPADGSTVPENSTASCPMTRGFSSSSRKPLLRSPVISVSPPERKARTTSSVNESGSFGPFEKKAQGWPVGLQWGGGVLGAC
mgnify:CR=1 FL=1